MAVPVTALYGAIHGLFNVALAMNVTRLRAKTKVFMGTGDSEELLVASRRHGNHTEYTALLVVLMLVAELSGGGARALHAVGGVYTLGRVAHAIGVGVKPSGPRAVGALFTWAAIAGAGVYGLMLAMR